MELDKPITIAVILFLVLVMIFYLVLPKYQAFQNILIEAGKKEAEFNSKNAYFVEITRVYKELMLYQDNLKKIETALPDKFSLASLVNFLYQKSAENGIILKRVTTGRGAINVKGDNLKEIYLTVEAFGSYPAFKNFISAIEKSSRLIEGENISFSLATPTIKNPEPSQTFPLTLQIKVYSY